MARCIRGIFIAAESNHGNPYSPLHMFFRTATVNLLHDPLQPKASAAICYGCCACSSHRLHQSHLFFFACSWPKFIHVFFFAPNGKRGFPEAQMPDLQNHQIVSRTPRGCFHCGETYACGRPFVSLFQDGFVATKRQR